MENAEQGSQSGPPTDIWQVIENSIPANRTTTGTASPEPNKPSPEEKAARKRSWRRWRRVVDAMAIAFWSYLACKLLIFDIDRAIIDAVAPSLSWLLTYRGLIIASIAVLVAIFMWRAKTLFALAYILMFPLIALLWKLPMFLYHRRSWLAVMGVLNAVGLMIRNLRYTLITKGAALIASIAIFTSESHPVLILGSAYLVGLLGWSSVRTVKRTLQANWFLEAHRQMIDRVLYSGIVRSLTTVDENVRRGEVAVLNSTELATVTNALSFSIISNRALYFWAYQLQKYRQARLTLLFNFATYVWLFLGGLFTLWLTNLALLKIDASQFQFAVRPSNVTLLLYSLATLALNEIGSLSSVGDSAHLIRIVAGLYGPLFLAFFVVNLLFSWRQQRDDDSLSETVITLKERAREQEALLRAQYHVGVDEALRRLEELGQGFVWFVGLITSAIPTDFLEDERDPKWSS